MGHDIACHTESSWKRVPDVCSCRCPTVKKRKKTGTSIRHGTLDVIISICYTAVASIDSCDILTLISYNTICWWHTVYCECQSSVGRSVLGLLLPTTVNVVRFTLVCFSSKSLVA